MKHLASVLALALAACSSGKAQDPPSRSGGDTTSGPPCAQVAAAYVGLLAAGGGNHVAALAPTADETRVLVARLEADCTTRPWPGATRACLARARSPLVDAPKCWPRGGMSAQVGQVVFDTVKELEAKRAP